MQLHTFQLTEAQAILIHERMADHTFALKNHTAMYVEQGNLEKAQECVRELREHQKLFALFNMSAKHDIAKFSGKDLEYNHAPRL